MLSRHVSLAVCLSVFAGAASAQSNQGTGYIFQLATAASSSGQLQGFIYNNQSLGTPLFNTAGPSGANQIIAKPDGSKFYVIGSGGLDDVDPNFTTPKAVNGISGTPTQAIITPDGRYLLVASTLGGGASAFSVLNTTNDAVVFTQSISGAVAGCSALSVPGCVGMVASRDSTTAYILAESGGGQGVTFLDVINLTLLQLTGSPVRLQNSISGDTYGGDAQALTLSPLGLLYVSAGNQILEINPTALQVAAAAGQILTPVEITPTATVGPLEFSPDGSMAYFINLTAASGVPVSLLSMALPSHNLSSWPTSFSLGQGVEQFDSIVVAGANSTGSPLRLFAHSPGDTTLWDIAPDFSTVGVSALNSVLPATSVLSMALSDELTSARYLFTLIASGSNAASLERVDLTTNTVTSQASAALGPGILQFSIVPSETNPTAIFPLTGPQTNLAAGAAAAPLIARILDSQGRPMFAVPVTFTGDPSLTFSGVTATSNEDGYVQATVTLGQTAGSYPVTLTAGTGSTTVTSTFSLTIPGVVCTTNCGSGATNQVTIVNGNGGLYLANSANFNSPALTVQVVDTNGNPLPNQDVTFTVTGAAIGVLGNPNATTDNNGLASTSFFPENLPQNIGFEGTTVTAVAPQGGVTFYETVYQFNADGTGGITLTGFSGQTITAGEGDVLPSAIVGRVLSNSYEADQPIPNVGLRIVTDDGMDNAGPGSCQGNPLSDATGTITCNFIAACGSISPGQTSSFQGFGVNVGGPFDFLGWTLITVPGSTRSIVIQSGNSQSGRPGAALTLPLAATVTDKCGAAASGVPVTWTVTKGSATLSATTTTSNQGGNVSTKVTLGQAAGTVQITASINSTTLVTFTETVTVVVGSLKLTSGGGQSALQNAAFTAPVVFQLTDTSNNPVAGLTVTFSVAGGSASIGSSSATTNAQGQASVNVTAGNTPGTVTITATYSTLTASATLTVTAQGPLVTVNSFVNAASLQAGLTPCGLATVTGSGLAPGVSGVILGNPLGIGPLPYFINNTNGLSITVNGTPAPLEAVANVNGVQQVNFQTPCETVPGSSATVLVSVGSVSTQVTGVTVFPAQPGIFTYAGPGDVQYGWVINAADGSYLGPSNLATAGQTYYLVATGMGSFSGALKTDAEGTGQTIPVSNVVLAINNVGIPVTSVQYVEGTIGEYIITFTIPVPFASGTNQTISLGEIVNGQQFFDNSQVYLPGIH